MDLGTLAWRRGTRPVPSLLVSEVGDHGEGVPEPFEERPVLRVDQEALLESLGSRAVVPDAVIRRTQVEVTRAGLGLELLNYVSVLQGFVVDPQAGEAEAREPKEVGGAGAQGYALV